VRAGERAEDVVVMPGATNGLSSAERVERRGDMAWVRLE
jgi:hypothetical protein